RLVVGDLAAVLMARQGKALTALEAELALVRHVAPQRIALQVALEQCEVGERAAALTVVFDGEDGLGVDLERGASGHGACAGRRASRAAPPCGWRPCLA